MVPQVKRGESNKNRLTDRRGERKKISETEGLRKNKKSYNFHFRVTSKAESILRNLSQNNVEYQNVYRTGVFRADSNLKEKIQVSIESVKLLKLSTVQKTPN